MTQKLHIKTWGCQMNEYDSSKMADLLLSTHGLELTEIPEEADVLLLNTCSIREKANAMGFEHAACGPFVRSSYHADLQASGGLVK